MIGTQKGRRAGGACTQIMLLARNVNSQNFIFLYRFASNRDKTAGNAVLSARGRVGTERRGESLMAHHQKSSFVYQKRIFEWCVPASRNVMFPSEVMRASRVMVGFAKWKETHLITCTIGANITFLIAFSYRYLKTNPNFRARIYFLLKIILCRSNCKNAVVL